MMPKDPREWSEEPEQPGEPEPADKTLPADSSAWGEDRTTLRKRSKGETGGEPCEWVLVIYSGGNLGRMFPLLPGNNVIGRAPTVEITLLDEEISRAHACIRLDLVDGMTPRLLLEDLGSTNGTFLNGTFLEGPRVLVPGDRLAMGDHVLKLVAMDPLERQFHATLLDQSTRDPLTGLANRGSTLADLQARFELSHRHNRPMSIIMVDLDFFKKINDSFGHRAGDRVLKAFGERVLQKLRGTDIAGRIGGEEFLIILPETELEGALQLGERLRAAIADPPMEWEGRALTVTCSLGVAERSPEDRDGGALLGRADAALYGAKHHGRNRVVSA